MSAPAPPPLETGKSPFVIDGVCHPYNFAPSNYQDGRFAEIFVDVLWSAIERREPDLRRDQWARDWGPEDFVETMLLESWTDMLCVHALPIYDAFKDGSVAVEKAAELKRRFPERVLWYATADVMQGEPALQSLEHQVRDLGAEGIKLYPALTYRRGRLRSFRMDDYDVAFPVFEVAQELGIRNIAIHKALPTGPRSSEAMRVDDIAGAASAFPDLNFQIVHAGFMFLEETVALLKGHPNVYATLESTTFLALADPPKYAYVLDELLKAAPDKVIYSSAATAGHPHRVLEAVAGHQPPPTARVPFDEQVRDAVLGGTLARLHGIDIPARRAALADDPFDRVRHAEGLRAPWTTLQQGPSLTKAPAGAAA